MTEHIGATIYTVAERAGVSIASVSRYLNMPSKVSKDTAEKIQAAMNQLSYIPHGNAGSKPSRQIGRIGILTPFFPAPSFVQRLQGMSPVFREANMEMIIYAVDSPEQLDEYLGSVPFYKRQDGIIVMSMLVSEEHSRRLLRSGIQVVMVEQSHPSFLSIQCDNVEGGALAARHFLEKGYGPCAFIGEGAAPPYSLRPSELRWKGYREELERSGRPVLPEHVRLGEGTAEDARRMALELFSLGNRPRAVFAMSDLQAIGVIKAAREAGLRVPQDIAILGFDDIEAADYVGLSTVSQSLAESGRLAAELLLGRIRDPGRPFHAVQLKVSIVQRGTT